MGATLLMARARPRVYDAEDLSRDMVERFNDRPVEYIANLRYGWPSKMQNVGDSLAVAYDSDKWKPKGKNGKRESELYKHLAESRNRALVKPRLLHNQYHPNKRWPVKGRMVSLAEVPMPQHFAILGLFEEVNLQLYTQGTKQRPAFSDDKDEGIVKVKLRHGMLGGSYLRWSEMYEDANDQLFLFVYTKSAGVCIVVVGDKLDVHRDGIIG